MLFSFKEFDETKNLIIKQFGDQPLLDLGSDDSQTIYQYQKLLNQIKYQKNVDHGHPARPTKSMPKFQKQFSIPQSASTRRVLPDNNSNMCQASSSDRFSKFKDHDSKFNSFNRLSSDEKQSNFYLTDIHQNDSRDSLKVLELKEINQSSLASKNEKQRISIQSEIIESKDLLNLRIGILELQNQQKYLETQISELEQSIRYYRCQNNEMQHKINQKEKKYLVELNLALKKQSDLNSATSRNKYFEQKLESTENFFTKSLKSIKLNRKYETKKCQEMVDDVTEKILTLKYLKKKIEEQRLQIAKLEQKHRYKSRRIQDSKNMKQYASILLKLQSLANFIKVNSYGKMMELSKLNQSLSRNNSDKNLGIGQESPNDEINFLQLTKEVLKVYFKLLSDEERLELNYEYKINQMASNRRIQCEETVSLPQCQEKENYEVKTIQSWKAPKKISKFFYESQKRQNAIDEHSQLRARQLKNEEMILDKGLTEAQIKKLLGDAKKISEKILRMQEKSKFFIKKCIKYLEHIVQKWLKFDQSAINFVVQVSNKFILIDSKIKKHAPECISKDILKDYFENWQRYIFFIEQFYNNPILNTFSSKEQLSTMFRRIIKTKCAYANVPTHRILIRYLKNMHSEKVSQIYDNIQNLLRVAVDIFQYSSKFQVFIVNDYQKEERQRESDPSSVIKNYSVHANKAEALKNDKNGYSTNTGNSIMKTFQKTKMKKIENEDENCSDIEIENELEVEKQKERQVSQANTVVNLIMDYQSEINKISKISKKHRKQ